MARSDLVVNLVRSNATGDAQAFRRTVEAIVAEEKAKQHHIVAERLERAMRAGNGRPATSDTRKAPESRSSAREYVSEVVPTRTLQDLVLSQNTRLGAEQLVEEQQRASVLRSHGLEPRHSALLIGPPGNGKTSLAEAIAEALAVPFFVVRYESMVGSFLGETATRLKRVFDYARTTPCVLFFDEFDAVGKERGDEHETGEIKRVVTSLLMQVDELPSYVVIVAATNHAELLDRAVWRRFELRLQLPAPTRKELAEFFSRLSTEGSIELGISPNRIAEALGAVSYGEAEQFFLDLSRRQVLSMGGATPAEIAREQLDLWSSRSEIPKPTP
jgi:SpoVK/Ycf46/Vps4 family AAA+-type ATPase